MGRATLRRRFWLEVALGTASAILAIGTILWHDWAEVLFNIDPDSGSGGFEVMVTLIVAAAALALFVLARIEWRYRVTLPS